jgi:hypothetical protein
MPPFTGIRQLSLTVSDAHISAAIFEQLPPRGGLHNQRRDRSPSCVRWRGVAFGVRHYKASVWSGWRAGRRRRTGRRRLTKLATLS